MSPAATIALLAAATAGGPGPAALAEAGRRLYEEGTRADGTEVLAQVGPDPSPVDARVLPCASCHGRDGRGRPEGAVVPPSLRWRELTKPYGHVHGPRRHPPFDERSLARAVQEGVDPAGQVLDAAMPRYSLSRTDVEGLVAWLHRLEDRLDPGLDAGTIRLGTVLPGGGPAEGAGLAMRRVLEAAVAEVNARGGVNGRRLALEVRDAGAGPAGAEAAVAALAGDDGVFALVSGLAPGGEAALAAAAERAGLPLVGPYSQRPEGDASLVFHLTGGAVEQARLLVDFAAREGGAGGGLVVLRPPGREVAPLASAVVAQAARRGLAAPREVEVPEAGLEPGQVRALAAAGVRTVVHLGDDAALAALLREATLAGWAATVLVPGALAGRAATASPPGFTGRVFLAYPTGPADETPAGRARLARLAGLQGPGRHRALQASAVGAVAVLVEGLRRAGRDLDRQALVARLEEVQSFETGLLPPITFGPGRRIGALGGYLVTSDPVRRTLRPVDGWRRLE